MTVKKSISPIAEEKPGNLDTKRDELGRTLLHITAALHGERRMVYTTYNINAHIYYKDLHIST